MFRSKTIRTKKVYIKKEDFKDEIKPSQKLKVINWTFSEYPET